MISICADGRGLTEDEYSASVATLQSLVSGERVSCVELRRWDCGSGLTGQYLLRTELDHTDFMEIRYDGSYSLLDFIPILFVTMIRTIELPKIGVGCGCCWRKSNKIIKSNRVCWSDPQ